MSYRSFNDPEGRIWEVWQVLPTSMGRRQEERRKAAMAGDHPYTGIERRKPATKYPLFLNVADLASEHQNGWLCFESDTSEKRRFSPIPEQWEAAANEQLVAWLRQAKRVVRCGP